MADGNRFFVHMHRPEDVIPSLGKKIQHWRDGYSAKELAKRWWHAEGIPEKVRVVLAKADGATPKS